MSAPYDPQFTAIEVAPDVTGTPGSYAPIGDLTDFGKNRGTDEQAEVFVFGASTPHTKAGEKTAELSLGGLLNLEDTNGQNVLADAYEADTLIWVKVTHKGASGDQAKGEEQQYRVTAYEENGEREGDFIPVAFTLVGVTGTAAPIPAES